MSHFFDMIEGVAPLTEPYKISTFTWIFKENGKEVKRYVPGDTIDPITGTVIAHEDI